MAKGTRLFDLFDTKKQEKQMKKTNAFFEKTISPILLAEEIEKAIRFIKVEQFHSGFPEIPSPEKKGGDIEVSIKQDHRRRDLFHINFRFVTLPDRSTLFSEQKLITYFELKKLAKSYDDHMEQVEKELNDRDGFVRNFPS